MLREHITRYQQHSLIVTETFDSVKIAGSVDSPIEPFCLEFFEVLKTLSNRDRFELFVNVSGNDEKISDCSMVSFLRLQEFLREYSNIVAFEIELTVRKNAEHSRISIYFIEAFADYLTAEPLLHALRTFSSYIDGQLELEVFANVSAFGSKTIRFFGASTGPVSAELVDASARTAKLGLLEDNSISSNLRTKLLPDDFGLTRDADNDKLTHFFKCASAVLSVIYIANFSELRGREFTYKISGYKMVICDGVDPAALSAHHAILLKIYQWAYEGGNNSDKVGLIRNVMSIHLDDAGAIRFDNDVWLAVQSNYQIYLRENIQSYLEVKNKLGEFIVESTSKTYAMADELMDAFKNNAFILLTFLLTVVVVNGLKDTGESTVFSNAYLAIVMVLAAVSCVWLLMTRIEVLHRFDNGAATISSVLKLNYQKILMESEIDESINPVVALNRKYLVSQVGRYTKWWFAMLIVFVLTFAVCNRIYSNNLPIETKAKNVDIVSAKDGKHQAENPKPPPLLKVTERSPPREP